MSEPVREIVPENHPELKIVEAPEESMPMAWHGALVKILLWVQAALLIFQAAMILLGKIYRASSVRAAVYAGMPAMIFIDTILAAALLAAALMCIPARKQLSNRSPKGIKLLLRAYILVPAAWIFYGAARFIAAGLSPFSIPVAGQCIAYIALLLVNRSYYKKRSSLFSEAAETPKEQA